MVDAPPHPGMIRTHPRKIINFIHIYVMYNSDNPGTKTDISPGSIPFRTVVLTFPFRVVHHGTLRVCMLNTTYLQTSMGNAGL